jgi:hypothetical protein
MYVGSHKTYLDKAVEKIASTYQQLNTVVSVLMQTRCNNAMKVYSAQFIMYY